MLSQAHRRSIHTSLAPVLGEEETEALMSEFPASPRDGPATKTDLELAMRDMRTYMDELFHKMMMQMMVVLASALVGGMALAAGIAAGVAQAIGGGP